MTKWIAKKQALRDIQHRKEAPTTPQEEGVSALDDCE